jgi:thiol-disulfide isomerase/thioredoxin
MMSVRFVLVCCLPLLVLSSPAATLALERLSVGPTVYSNVVVLGANATDLYFRHQSGIANVKLKYLSPTLQKQFGYDPKAAAEEERKQSEMDALYQKGLEMDLAAQAASAKAAKQKLTSEDSFADPISTKSWLGKPAPAFDFGTWIGEKPTLEGKSVLLTFWAPWSLPCRKWIPELNALQKKFGEKLVLVAVCSEPQTEVSEIPGVKPEFPAAIDPKWKFASALGVTSVPCVILLDSKGVVRYQGHPSAITEQRLEAFLAKATE